MGAVYKAEHRLMERVVALKVMNRALVASETTVDRFRREVKAAARLSHPNIVAAYDAEQAGAVHFLVMEYVEGTDLARWLAAHGPLPADEACDYIRQAALGLQHAHEHGMIHRDIKPHNLMRTPDGTIKVLDFGLARLAAEVGAAASGVTGQGTLLGTVDYLAPEQADDAHQADIRSDIYSLGCTLYHLLSGRPPFPKGTVVQKIMAHTEREPESLQELRPDLPPGLARVVRRMMAKSPEDRYQTPDDVCAALGPFAGQTVVLDPRAAQEADREAEGVRPLSPPLAGRGGGRPAGAGWAGRRRGRLSHPDRQRRVGHHDRQPRCRGRHQAERQAGADHRHQDRQRGQLESGFYDLELGGQAEGLKLSLDKVTIHRGKTALATVERRPRPALAAEKVGEVRSFAWGAKIVHSAAFSPDGLAAVSGDTDGNVRLWDLGTGKEVRRLPGHAAVPMPWRSRRTAKGSQRRQGCRSGPVRLATGKEVRRFAGHERAWRGPRFRPTGSSSSPATGEAACPYGTWRVARSCRTSRATRT